jgi:hypothetical protein
LGGCCGSVGTGRRVRRSRVIGSSGGLTQVTRLNLLRRQRIARKRREQKKKKKEKMNACAIWKRQTKFHFNRASFKTKEKSGEREREKIVL